MTVATLVTATNAENRKAVIAGTIGNVLEWYDFGVFGYLATTMSQLFFPGDDKTISLLKAFAVFGVGFVMRPVGSVVFGIYGDRFGRRLALSAVIFSWHFQPWQSGYCRPTPKPGCWHQCCSCSSGSCRGCLLAASGADRPPTSWNTHRKGGAVSSDPGNRSASARASCWVP